MLLEGDDDEEVDGEGIDGELLEELDEEDGIDGMLLDEELCCIDD